MYRFANAVTALSLAFLLTGCATVPFDTSTTTANATVEGLAGNLHGGQQAIVGSTVKLYAVGTIGYGDGATLLATATSTTDAHGAYTFGTITCPYSNTPTYLLATGGNAGGGTNTNIVLASASGACGSLASATVNINEVTTAATAYAMGQFFTKSLTAGSDSFSGTAAGSGTYNQGLVYADLYTVPMLVDLTQQDATKAAKVTTTSGTLTTTRESAKLYSLANTLAACVNSASPFANCTSLRNYTNTAGTPTDTLQAAVQIALYPYKNVANLYTLPAGASPFIGLSTAPNDWTLGISYTTTTAGLGILGSSDFYQATSNLDIDETGNVWFPSNSTTNHGLGEFKPSTGTFSPLVATALVTPQYLTITRQNVVWGSDLTYLDPNTNGHLVSSGGVTFTNSTGTSNHGTVGPVAASYNSASSDNLDFFDLGNVQYTGVYLDYQRSGSYFDGADGATNEGIAIVSSGTADTDYLASSGYSGGGETYCTLSSVLNNNGGATYVTTTNAPCLVGGLALTASGTDALMSTNANQVCNLHSSANSGTGTCFAPAVGLNNPKGIAVDGLGNIWVANSGNASVSTFGNNYVYSSTNTGASTNYVATSTLPYLHSSTYGGTIGTPYGIAIDRSGNVWLSNAGCISTDGAPCNATSFTLSEFVGAAIPTNTPLAIQNINYANTQTARPVAN